MSDGRKDLPARQDRNDPLAIGLFIVNETLDICDAGRPPVVPLNEENDRR